MAKKPSIVIIGGGFAGLRVARGLSKVEASVTLVDKNNYHLFQPLLYQVAAAALSPADIAQPIRSILSEQSNVTILLEEVRSIDTINKKIELSTGELPFDFLVLAAGVGQSYFGNEDWATHSLGLKTIEDAIEIRKRVLLAFEEAELEENPAVRTSKLTFVVVGGGPTGVELAGALKEIGTDFISSDFRRIDTKTARVVLIEGNDRLLSGMSEASSAKALKDLQDMGVEVRLENSVTKVSGQGVVVGDEELKASVVLWAAGVQASSLTESLNSELDDSGRVIVESDLSLPNHDNIFVIGDIASAKCAKSGEPVPGVAQGALQMGAFVADILTSELRKDSSNSRPAFIYSDKGTMATIGKARAVADIKGMSFGGFSAWFLWLAVHLLFLLGFRRKLFVMLSWCWSYLFQSKGARLITGRRSF